MPFGKRRFRDFFAAMERPAVLVVTTAAGGGLTYEGVLDKVYDDTIILMQARLIQGSPQAPKYDELQGWVCVDRSKIAFVQVRYTPPIR